MLDEPQSLLQLAPLLPVGMALQRPLTAIVGGVLLFSFMNPEYRHTFYRRLPARKHILDFHWHTRTTSRIAAPYRSALTGPIPRTWRRASAVGGRAGNEVTPLDYAIQYTNNTTNNPTI